MKLYIVERSEKIRWLELSFYGGSWWTGPFLKHTDALKSANADKSGQFFTAHCIASGCLCPLVNRRSQCCWDTADYKRSLPQSQSLQLLKFRILLGNNSHAILERQGMFIKNLGNIFLFLLTLTIPCFKVLWLLKWLLRFYHLPQNTVFPTLTSYYLIIIQIDLDYCNYRKACQGTLSSPSMSVTRLPRVHVF